MDFEWPSYMNDIHFVLQIPVIAFTPSHLDAKQITLSFQKLLCLFLFSLQMHPGHSSAPAKSFHKKARAGLKASNWQRLLAPFLQPLLPESYSLSLHYIMICVSSH